LQWADLVDAAAHPLVEKHATPFRHDEALRFVIEAEHVSTPEPRPGNSEVLLDAALLGTIHLHHVATAAGATPAASGTFKSKIAR